MMTTIEITGYGRRASEKGVRVAQTGERIVSGVPAKAVALVEAKDWAGLVRLARRSNLRLSTDVAGLEGVSVGYGAACLAEIRDARIWRGCGGFAALRILSQMQA